MKKVLVLAAVLVCFCNFLNAASIKWGSLNSDAKVAASSSGGDLSNYIVYLCSGSTAGILDSIQAGTWSAPTIGLSEGSNVAVSKTLTSAGLIGAGASILDSTALVAGSTTGSYSFYLVIFDEAKENVLISSALDGTLYNESGSDPATFVRWDQDQLIAGSNGWQSISGVPEPTAFALLALGVAGMALRRKVK